MTGAGREDRATRRRAARGAGLAVLLLAAVAVARADWLQPDASVRDAQLALRLAIRDTVGQPPTPARLDSLAVAHLRLGDLDAARPLFERALAADSGDATAAAGLGKIALFRDDPAAAERLLAPVAAGDPAAAADLQAARLRRGEWAAAADLAERAGESGRAALLRMLAAPEGAWRVSAPAETRIDWIRCWPVPIVKGRVNGRTVLLAVDTGVEDLLLDPVTARACGVQVLAEQAPVLWCGTRVPARLALAQRLDLGGARIERVPAATLPMRRWSLDANPGGEAVGGVIGANVLARFVPTLDYRRCALVLRRGDAPFAPPPGARTVPFELWGEREIVVRGSLGGSRPVALLLATGVPGCGIGAPQSVLDEVGVRPGSIARAVGAAGSWLKGTGWASVQVPTVSVGPIVRGKVPGCSGAFDEAELWRRGVRRDGLVSSDFLRGERVTVDWAGRRLVFE